MRAGRECHVADYVELMGFGPKGWGLLMAQATLMTIAVSATAFALGSALGALVAWARIEGKACELLDRPPRGVTFGR